MNFDLSAKDIEQKIYFVRGHRVMFDSDLAELYQIDTKVLNQAVRRNDARFPKDFMFQLSESEYISLRSQIVTLESGRGKYRKYLPFVFTEQGVSMLSSVLKSKVAIQVNIAIMRAFVQLRAVLEAHQDLAKKLNEIEQKLKEHDHEFESPYLKQSGDLWTMDQSLFRKKLFLQAESNFTFVRIPQTSKP